ncbi:uncharacterized protein ACHE_40841S [Aspergillus chevalieri]|uniref:Uncharacterized protein n=1 Tax=Aspergillus chevalieri TaxID=182096 RepID=A0A7R7ZPF3_ASPCH|nr:uncharacterized protein ACHE_40841S [Aspergillus chevalieri]BCR88277.1 hypothetical protein ACHE_40841S [Aspergillus chevalieri]
MNHPSAEPSLPPQSSPRSRLSISEHRRSALASLNSNMADSTVAQSDPRSSSKPRASNGGSPILATTGDPHHHHRTPSLGELHQELEQEQEAQVNRLLQMIRSQQAQLQQLQQQQQPQSSGTAIVDETTPHSDSTPFPPFPPLPTASGRTSTQLSPSFSSRRQSRPSSQAASPNLRPQPSLHHLRGPPEGLESLAGTSDNAASRSNSRDECAFYQAEAAMLSRENQMLRQRIRDLERQVASQTQPDSAVDKT